ncbi:MAG TPA: redoxin domain-containing protein [Nocardioides sp.]|nr:redoxin domain-containing protein [Nocardioides sp.]
MSYRSVLKARAEREERAREIHRADTRRRRVRVAVWLVAVVAVVGAVTAMMLSSRPESSSDVRRAPDFSLVDTSGATHTLAQHRGENVLLYFSEGAGCQACLMQMAAIEKDQDAYAAEDVTVLPVVMNTRSQIMHDMRLNGVTTPFLLDDGTVSEAYDTLGKGMHAGLPGHSFVLIDEEGTQRWYGEYPSMWLDPVQLLEQVRDHLGD